MLSLFICSLVKAVVVFMSDPKQPVKIQTGPNKGVQKEIPLQGRVPGKTVQSDYPKERIARVNSLGRRRAALFLVCLTPQRG